VVADTTNDGVEFQIYQRYTRCTADIRGTAASSSLLIPVT